ncbi:MAG: YggS family pyridoxal phosphate-dependent enzyme [Candidatus Sumerlaeaceae bacterium]|nr:YggS family pyridoxal phosphate-dependent enzyme [Candidatus Sumerlaeaceae bacterium]
MYYAEQAIAERAQEIRGRIAAACERSGRRPEHVRIVAVTKTHPVEAVVAAWHAGLRDFGENRVQEAEKKFSLFQSLIPNARAEGCLLHLIGHLQTNKAKLAVALFDLIHSVDSAKLADELEKYASRMDKRQAILIQVNTSRESTKSGVELENAERLVEHVVKRCPHLMVAGYMTMAPIVCDPEQARPYFAQLRMLRDRLEQSFAGAPHYEGRELSMGMTGDFEVAVEEGATIVRIGTALFGSR